MEDKFRMRDRGERRYSFGVELTALCEPDSLCLVDMVSLFAILFAEALVQAPLCLIGDKIPADICHHVELSVRLGPVEERHVLGGLPVWKGPGGLMLSSSGYRHSRTQTVENYGRLVART